MKKVISIALIVVMLASVFSFNVFAADEIQVTIDGTNQTYDVMPVIENGRTLVPMRAIFEALGATINWDDATKTVTGTKDNVSVELRIGDTNAKVNGMDKTLDVPAQIVNSRTLVPVRFVSEAMGCDVKWDDVTKTVIINSNSGIGVSQPGLAKLVSTYHRRVPTEFEKTNDLNDNFYFEPMTPDEQETLYQNVRGQGEIVCNEDEFMSGITPFSNTYGNCEIVDIEGQNFKKVLRITCTSVPEKTTNFIIRTKATPERNPGDGVDANDVMLLAFRLRCISGGDENGCGKVQVQIEHPETYRKAVFSTAIAGKDWTVVYMPFSGVKDATSIGIRGGFFEQIVELGGIEIINYGPTFDYENLPFTSLEEHPELKKDAAWRKDANERIEKIRKGDFTVVVKDGAGNAIPGAEVELDMFEHQFQFGNAFHGGIKSDKDYQYHHETLFNAGVVEHQMKWAPYEDKPEETKGQVEGAKKSGVKYMRGHTLIWERTVGSDGVTYLMPKRLFDNDAYKDKEYLMNEVDAFFERMISEYPDIIEWDVVNEIVVHTIFRDHYGKYELFKEYFDLARKYAGEDCLLYYNETSPVWEQDFIDYLDKFEEMNVDYDGIGIQSHYSNDSLKPPSELMELYKTLREKYNKRLKITEYTYNDLERYRQANYTRDVMITCFAEENMDGFLTWGFYNDSRCTPLYDKKWNLTPAGKVYVDLVYNKWWTRDAKANTDSNGKAIINGYYGDYDITVNANGKVRTYMAAFHKGYDNVLEINIDDPDYVEYDLKTGKIKINVEPDPALPSGGNVILSSNDFYLMENITSKYGSCVFENGAMKANVTELPEKDMGFTVNLANFKKGDIKKDDVCMLTYKLKVNSGTPYLKWQVQTGAEDNYKKALFNLAELRATDDWVTCYMPFKGIDNLNDIGVRLGGAVQNFELKDFQLINYGTAVSLESLPSTMIK